MCLLYLCHTISLLFPIPVSCLLCVPSGCVLLLRLLASCLSGIQLSACLCLLVPEDLRVCFFDLLATVKMTTWRYTGFSNYDYLRFGRRQAKLFKHRREAHSRCQSPPQKKLTAIENIQFFPRKTVTRSSISLKLDGSERLSKMIVSWHSVLFWIFFVMKSSAMLPANFHTYPSPSVPCARHRSHVDSI